MPKKTSGTQLTHEQRDVRSHRIEVRVPHAVWAMLERLASGSSRTAVIVEAIERAYAEHFQKK